MSKIVTVNLASPVHSFVSQSTSQSSGVAAKVASKPTPTHHILVVDCSGSMSGDLPNMRNQIKNKIPGLLNAGDRLSLVWFSGKGQAGTIFENVEVNDLSDLTRVQSKVDQWLRPVGCTGFVDPLNEAARIVGNSRNNKLATSVLFMTDGYDNEWSEQKILSALDTVGADSVAIVEYGYYANRNLLAKMAARVGAAHIFAENFAQYQPTVERVLTRRITPALKSVEVNLEFAPFLGLVVTLNQGEIVAYTAEGKKVTLPETVEKVFYLANAPRSNKPQALPKEELDGVYALISALSVRMQPDAVLPLLALTGDVRFIKDFSGCYGKQRYSAFMNAAKEAAFNPSKRLIDGFNPLAVPDANAFTVLDVLRILSEDKEARLMLDSDQFQYNAISRGRVNADDTMSAEAMAEVQEITTKMAANAKNKKLIHELSDRLNEITASQGLRFKASPNPEGYALSSLTYNENRANISVMVRKNGEVDISGKLPHNLLDKLPKTFPTHVFRNYAIVKDGMVNVKRLPVRLSKASLDEMVLGDGSILTDPPTDLGNGVVEATLDLSNIPVINRAMVAEVSAKHLFSLEYDLHVAQSEAKVFNALLKELGVEKKESKGFAELYGEEGAAWLKDNGFSEHNGFSPKKTTQAEATDKYVTREIKVALKGYSSLPSLNDVRTKIASKKPVNAAGSIMVSALERWNKQTVNGSLNPPTDWLRAEAAKATSRSREILANLARVKFAILVGQVWPSEFKSIEENTLELGVAGGVNLTGTLDVKEVTVEILPCCMVDRYRRWS